ncbi:MAG TPA: hypothetical protein VMF13_08880, partial [Luteitalea sp.]|nr:hypothetical protein [Luteitalea sp.]
MVRRSLIFGSMMAMCAGPVAAQAPAVPTYQAHRVVDAITVDGRLDELTWALRPRVGQMRLITDLTR